MSTTETTKARTLARLLHRGQNDKAGRLVFSHVCRVALQATYYGEMTVAFLHDVVEDTECTLDDLRGLGFAEITVRAVDALTRRRSETYGEYIERVAAYDGPFALEVKLADLRDHLRTGYVLDKSLVKRYRRALARLATVSKGKTPDAQRQNARSAGGSDDTSGASD